MVPVIEKSRRWICEICSPASWACTSTSINTSTSSTTMVATTTTRRPTSPTLRPCPVATPKGQFKPFNTDQVSISFSDCVAGSVHNSISLYRTGCARMRDYVATSTGSVVVKLKLSVKQFTFKHRTNASYYIFMSTTDDSSCNWLLQVSEFRCHK